MTSIDFASLVASYGYAAAFAGVVAEGETVLIAFGIAAHEGYLGVLPLVAIGAAAAILTDNAFFLAGRVFGPALLARFPRLSPSIAKAHSLIARFPNAVVIGLRFTYGMRSIGPCVIGAGTMAWSRFVVLDVIAASVWSASWVAAGYLLGAGMQRLQGSLARDYAWLPVVAGLALGIAALALIAHACRSKWLASRNDRGS
jgi:membrane protein DedA with SNARE-associated domain